MFQKGNTQRNLGFLNYGFDFQNSNLKWSILKISASKSVLKNTLSSKIATFVKTSSNISKQ